MKPLPLNWSHRLFPAMLDTAAITVFSLHSALNQWTFDLQYYIQIQCTMYNKKRFILFQSWPNSPLFVDKFSLKKKSAFSLINYKEDSLFFPLIELLFINSFPVLYWISRNFPPNSQNNLKSSLNPKTSTKYGENGTMCTSSHKNGELFIEKNLKYRCIEFKWWMKWRNAWYSMQKRMNIE